MSLPQRPHASASERQDIRRRERRSVSMRGFAVREDGTTLDICLLDLSYDGCCVEAAELLRPGEVVKISVLRRGAIDAEVRWCADGKAGLTFVAEAQADEKQQQQPRRSERISTTAEVVIRRLGGANYRVGIADLSPYGCKVELIDRPNVGEHMLVRIDGLEPLEAEVCWVTQHLAGVRFEKPIHGAVFDLLAERLKGG